jgi:hypothetical protein
VGRAVVVNPDYRLWHPAVRHGDLPLARNSSVNAPSAVGSSVYKPVSEPLDLFIFRTGGINACAALGRGAALDCEAQANPRRRSPKAGQIAHSSAPQGRGRMASSPQATTTWARPRTPSVRGRGRGPGTSVVPCREAGVGLVSRVTPVQTAMRNCTRDEGRSFEVGNQVLISNHRKLLWSKATVVNVAEKSEQDSGRYD